MTEGDFNMSLNMNEYQKQFVASKTCYILDCHPNIEEQFLAHGIPQELTDKITKAFDLIFEVNQACQEEKEL